MEFHNFEPSLQTTTRHNTKQHKTQSKSKSTTSQASPLFSQYKTTYILYKKKKSYLLHWVTKFSVQKINPTTHSKLKLKTTRSAETTSYKLIHTFNTNNNHYYITPHTSTKVPIFNVIATFPHIPTFRFSPLHTPAHPTTSKQIKNEMGILKISKKKEKYLVTRFPISRIVDPASHYSNSARIGALRFHASGSNLVHILTRVGDCCNSHYSCKN